MSNKTESSENEPGFLRMVSRARTPQLRTLTSWKQTLMWALLRKTNLYLSLIALFGISRWELTLRTPLVPFDVTFELTSISLSTSLRWPFWTYFRIHFGVTFKRASMLLSSPLRFQLAFSFDFTSIALSSSLRIRFVYSFDFTWQLLR